VDTEFRSSLEAGVAAQLEANDIKYGYEVSKFKYKKRISSGECDACGHKKVSQNKNYLADFTIHNGDIIEAKGYFHATDRAKMLAVREHNRDLRIAFVFGADNKLSKNNEKRYSDWCREHGFTYCIRKIPSAWFRRWRKAAVATTE
jgi:hypothetical protein